MSVANAPNPEGREAGPKEEDWVACPAAEELVL